MKTQNVKKETKQIPKNNSTTYEKKTYLTLKLTNQLESLLVYWFTV